MEDGIIHFGDHRKGHGSGREQDRTRKLADATEVSRIDPEVVAQIFAIRENLILSDPLGATEQSVATVDLASVIRWLEFADSAKVSKYPSFYVRVLNRFVELKPDLGGLLGRLNGKLRELEDSCDAAGVAERIDALRNAVRGLAQGQVARGFPEKE